MGCSNTKTVGSQASQNAVNSEFVTRVTSNPYQTTRQEAHSSINSTDNMRRAQVNTKSKGSEAKGNSNKPATASDSETVPLHKRIRSLNSISSDDAEEAITLTTQHPSWNDEFEQFLSIIDLFHQSQHDKFVVRVSEIMSTYKNPEKNHLITLIDFFAYIGGAEATVTVYKNTLKANGWTHITEEVMDWDSEESKEMQLARFKVQEFRSFWVDATDASMVFAAHLAETGLFLMLVEDVKNLKESDFEYEADLFDTPVTILYNCARNQQLRQHFRDISAISLLTPMLARKETGVKLLTLLTLSYIIDEEDNHLLQGADRDFQFLLEMIKAAWGREDHRDYNGYSLEELLQGLSNLAQNDDNKKLLIKQDTIKYLKPILQDGQEAEKKEALKVVWELSFNKETQHLIREDSSLMDVLHKLKKHENKVVARNANGALWVLNMGQKIGSDSLQSQQDRPVSVCGKPPPAPPPPPRSSQLTQGRPPPPHVAEPQKPAVNQGHVMISYQWGNQKILLQIRDKLRENNFRVWMDVDNISGSTLQAMADAVEGASAVLMCMSQRYKDSPNCRTEAEYAFALNKPIIPLLMERSYRPNGWLGILLGSKLFFDFSGKYPFERKLDELIRELGHRGLNGSPQSETEIIPVEQPVLKTGPPQAARTPDPAAWSQKDVAEWLKTNKLDGNSSLKGLSGENIKFLQKLSHRAPEFYFTYLKQDLGLKNLNDLMKFSNAMDALP